MKAKFVALLLIVAFAACKSKDKGETLSLEVSPQDTVQVAEVQPVPEPVVKIIDEGVNLDDTYFLIVNSYTIEELAQSWNKVYQDKGYKSGLVMKDDDGYFRLALKSFDDLQLAKDALREMQKKEEFDELWIMLK